MNQKKYLIYDWTETDGGEPIVFVVTEGRLFEIISDCRFQKEAKFAVYEIGECILDWS